MSDTAFGTVDSTQLAAVTAQAPNEKMEKLWAEAGLADTSNLVGPAVAVAQLPTSPDIGYVQDLAPSEENLRKIGETLVEAGVALDPERDR